MKIINLAGAALLATSLMVMSAVSADGLYVKARAVDDIYASKLEGMRVYMTEMEVDDTFTGKRITTEFDDIGEVNSILLDKSGRVKAVIIGVGGFLGVGERDVAVKMDSLTFMRERDEDPDEFFVVLNASKTKLETAPEYTR